jgi:pSer/pThr/pTyr-binding forkhead associated (FHA) protein
VYCPECGFQHSDAANFCEKCGAAIIADAPTGQTTAAYTLGEPDADALSPSAVPAGAGPALVVRAGGGRAGEHFVLAGDSTTIGRSPGGDIMLDDVTVSREHARVVRRPDGLYIEDSKSLNGTYVNRRRIEAHRLSDGDELQIGKFKLTFLER